MHNRPCRFIITGQRLYIRTSARILVFLPFSVLPPCPHVAKGPSIKYVTLLLANFNPPPPVTLCHTSRDPPKSTSHISDPPSRPSSKNPDKSPLYKFSLNCTRGLLSMGL